MNPTGDDIQGALQALGAFEDILGQAETVTVEPLCRVNTHIHLPPNFSAFDTIDQAVQLAAEQGVKLLGAGNYYDYSVYRTFTEASNRHGIFSLYGTEIIALDQKLKALNVRVNDPGNPGKTYLCGKGLSQFTAMTEKATALLQKIRQNDQHRMAEMVTRIANHFEQRRFATGMTEQKAIDRIVQRHQCDPETVVLQERHVAQVFQEVLFEKAPSEDRAAVLTQLFDALPQIDVNDPVAVQNTLRSALMKAGKPCYVPETFVSPDEAVSLILELGGIPCYPIVADMVDPFTEFESPIENLIRTLKGRGFHMIEFITIRNSIGVLDDYVKKLRQAGFVISAGTEHNTLDLIPIDPLCKGGQPVPDDLREIFWEGACVVVAHQWIQAWGRCGFVDGDGQPNPGFADDESRIQTFARIGQAVLQRFFKQ